MSAAQCWQVNVNECADRAKGYTTQTTDDTPSHFGNQTLSETQILFVDTPGIHSNQKRAINRYMNRVAQSVIADVDVTVMLVDRHIFTADDEMILERIQKGCHLILAINKVDRIRQ